MRKTAVARYFPVDFYRRGQHDHIHRLTQACVVVGAGESDACLLW
jgi:hypothetical protein